MWEMRVFDDLRAFTSREGNFCFVRDARLEVSAEDKGASRFLVYNSRSRTTSASWLASSTLRPPRTPRNPAPTPPRAPEAFSNLAPLPYGVALEPLVNVAKQRRIARVIKALVAGQHLADAARSMDSAQSLNVGRRPMQRCVRLKALDAQGLRARSGPRRNVTFMTSIAHTPPVSYAFFASACAARMCMLALLCGCSVAATPISRTTE